MENSERDEMLWRIAKKRVGFKWNFIAYIIINAFLIGVWYFTSGRNSYFWPIWPMLGWGIGIAFNYAEAYHSTRSNAVQNEYEKLKRQEKL